MTHIELVRKAYDMANVIREFGAAPEVRSYDEFDVEVIAWLGVDSYANADDTTQCICWNVKNATVEGVRSDMERETA